MCQLFEFSSVARKNALYTTRAWNGMLDKFNIVFFLEMFSLLFSSSFKKSPLPSEKKTITQKTLERRRFKLLKVIYIICTRYLNVASSSSSHEYLSKSQLHIYTRWFESKSMKPEKKEFNAVNLKLWMTMSIIQWL